MINKAFLIGRLTRDPELRYLPNGTSVTSFTIAVDRNYTNQQGERETDFIPIVVWRNLAETCAKYLTKGRLVAVLGRIQTRNYEAQDGTRRYVTEIVADEVQFLDRARGGDAPLPQGSGFEDPTGFSPIDGDDELPF